MSNLTGRPIPQKGQKPTKTALRPAARNMRCTLRLGHCSGPETVVLAHIRRFGWAGVGQKPHDILGVHACARCHDILDGRANGVFSDTDLLRALGETLVALIESGNLSLK